MRFCWLFWRYREILRRLLCVAKMSWNINCFTFNQAIEVGVTWVGLTRGPLAPLRQITRFSAGDAASKMGTLVLIFTRTLIKYSHLFSSHHRCWAEQTRFLFILTPMPMMLKAWRGLICSNWILLFYAVPAGCLELGGNSKYLKYLAAIKNWHQRNIWPIWPFSDIPPTAIGGKGEASDNIACLSTKHPLLWAEVMTYTRFYRGTHGISGMRDDNPDKSGICNPLYWYLRGESSGGVRCNVIINVHTARE